MKYLLLWLEGPLQSWGADSRFDLRKTLKFPTMSGIYGMLLASSGDSGPQEALLERMASASFTVVTFKSGSRILMDFHMAGNGYTPDRGTWESLNIPRKNDGKIAVGGGAKRTYREYLQDQEFAVIIGFEDDLAEKFSASMQNPVYDLYLGRKCCVPTSLIYRGLFASEAEAFDGLQKLLAEPGRKSVETQWIIRTASPGEESSGQLLNDVPLRFGENRLYRDRWIVFEPFPAQENVAIG